jgi:hypothetical protein
MTQLTPREMLEAQLEAQADLIRSAYTPEALINNLVTWLQMTRRSELALAMLTRSEVILVLDVWASLQSAEASLRTPTDTIRSQGGA